MQLSFHLTPDNGSFRQRSCEHMSHMCHMEQFCVIFGRKHESNMQGEGEMKKKRVGRFSETSNYMKM